MNDAQNKWKMFKNYLHNELGITKEDIESWVKEAVIRVAENYVKNQLSDRTLNRIVEEVVNDNWGKGYKVDVRSLVADKLVERLEITMRETHD